MTLLAGERVLVLGAGTMGRGIAALCARVGFPVVLYEPMEPARLAARERVAEILGRLAAHRVILSKEIEPALTSVSVTADLEAAANATFIIEAIPEDVGLKRSVFGLIDRLAPPRSVLATNSSSFTLADIGVDVAHSERLLATHFYNPAELIPLVEIATTDATADWAIKKATALMEAIGKVPVRCRDSSGYIAVRLQVAMVYEAIRLLEQGLATADDIDKAVRCSFGPRVAVMGPLEMADRGGLDIWLNAGDYLHRTYGGDKFAAPKLLRDKVARGELGVKTGRGLHGDTASLVAGGRDGLLVGLLQHLGLLPTVDQATD